MPEAPHSSDLRLHRFSDAPATFFVHAIMSYVGQKTSALLRAQGTCWQDGYYDTRVKTAKQFEFVAHYIEQNPVTKGFVERPEDWNASSAKRQDLTTDPWPWVYD
jgi:REP element-mobilizing transposase RayT